MTTSVDPREILSSWAGKEVQVTVRSTDSDGWLARFWCELGDADAGNQWPVRLIGDDREAFIGLPYNLTGATLPHDDVLLIQHPDGRTEVVVK